MDLGTLLLMLGLSYALGLLWYSLLPAKLPERVEQSSLKEDVVKELSREKLEETLEEVTAAQEAAARRD